MLDGCGSERDLGAVENGTTTMSARQEPEVQYIEYRELYILILTK